MNDQVNITISYQCGSIHDNCHDSKLILLPGFYLFEVYGASGGDSLRDGRFDEGGKGGFSRGFYYIRKTSEIYVYVGAKGKYVAMGSSAGGWNGGGVGTYSGASGGGATDIRLKGGEWNDTESLHSRIIVGGGGGGAFGGSLCHAAGGDGGGLIGGRTETIHECPQYFKDVCVGTQSGCEGGEPESKGLGDFGGGGAFLEGSTPGGGGGYWGGGSGDRVSGGGSGFIGEVVSHRGMEPFTEGGVNSGDGFAIISLVDILLCKTPERMMIAIFQLTSAFILSILHD